MISKEARLLICIVLFSLSALLIMRALFMPSVVSLPIPFSESLKLDFSQLNALSILGGALLLIIGLAVALLVKVKPEE